MSENKKSVSSISYSKIILSIMAVFALFVAFSFTGNYINRKQDESFLSKMEKQFNEVDCECQPAVARNLHVVFEVSLICGNNLSLCSHDDYSEDVQDFLRVLEEASTGASVEACKAAADEERCRDTQ